MAVGDGRTWPDSNNWATYVNLPVERRVQVGITTNGIINTTFTASPGSIGGNPYVYLPLGGTTVSPFEGLETNTLAPSRINRLTPEQQTRVLAHAFEPIEESSPWCLLCFALDLYRGREEHSYMIREE